MTTAAPTIVTPDLPTPEERPEADVVIYDGDCRFCTSGVENLHRWDHRGRLAFVSLHDPSVAERYPDLSHEQLMDQMYLIDQQGNRHGGAEAFRYLTRRLPLLWPLAPFMHIPFSLPMWQWLYRKVAKNRYRLMGKMSGEEACENGACKVHFDK